MFILLNSLSLIFLIVIGGYIFFSRRSFLFGLFSLSYATLFSAVPILNYYLNGFLIYHPEAVYGLIDDELIFNNYSIINFMFSLLICFFVFVYVYLGRNSYIDFSRFNLNFIIIVSSVSFVSGFFIYLFSLGFNGLNPVSWLHDAYEAGRMAHFKNSGFSSLLMNISFYLMSLVSLSFFLVRRNKLSLLVVFVFGIVVLFTLVAGGRQALILAISGMFAAAYFNRQYNMFYLVLSSFLALCLLVFLQFFRSRNGGSIDFDVIMNLIVSGDLSYFYYASLEAIRQYEYYDVSFFGAFYRNLLFIIVPADWTMGLKMRDLSTLFAFAFESSADFRAGNYPPGLIGLFVLNFGFLGFILVGFFILSMFFYIECLSSNSLLKLIFYSLFLFFLLQLFRGTLMGYYYLVFQILMISLCVYMRKSLILLRY